MSFKRVGIVLLLIFSIMPLKSHAQSSNAGFVPANIWYSTDPFEEGDKIKIYTLIFNPDGRELSGTVVFFDNSVFLGKKDFTAPAKGMKDVSIDWTATVGSHSIFGKIENAKFLISKGNYEEVYLAENETSKSTRTVNKKIILKEPEKTPSSLIESVGNAGGELVKNIEEKTPDFIAKPATLAANAVEGFRSNLGTASENKKTAIGAEIKTINIKSQTSSDAKNGEPTRFLKPFKYAELFFFGFLSFILNNKFIFYSVSAVILFFIIRYIWRLIF